MYAPNRVSASTCNYSADSGQNSMENWDSGPDLENTSFDYQDLDAASELGRTLLERNRELEAIIRQQQAQIDDQAQEMQYLAKQTSLLRQAAESRLRLCEQLESSVGELERAKSRAICELSLERHRNRRLRAELEMAEEKCFELQRSADQSRASDLQTQMLVRSLRQQLVLERGKTDDETQVQETEDPSQKPDNCVLQDASQKADDSFVQMVEALAEAEEKLSASNREIMEERRKRLELEAELHLLQEENCVFQQQTHESVHLEPPNPPIPLDKKRLSICEELLLSSGEFWDSIQPSSLTDGGTSSSISFHLKEDDYSNDCEKHSLKRITESEDVYSSSSGFSEEGLKTDSVHGCIYQCAYCRCLTATSSCSSTPSDLHRTITKCLEENKVKINEISRETRTDVKILFEEIFAVLRKNMS